jgi:hypothetical protein
VRGGGGGARGGPNRRPLLLSLFHLTHTSRKVDSPHSSVWAAVRLCAYLFCLLLPPDLALPPSLCMLVPVFYCARSPERASLLSALRCALYLLDLLGSVNGGVCRRGAAWLRLSVSLVVLSCVVCGDCSLFTVKNKKKSLEPALSCTRKA